MPRRIDGWSSGAGGIERLERRSIHRYSMPVTQSNDPTIEGWEALFQIRDNGEGGRGDGPDLMSSVLLHEVGIGPDCLIPSEFDLVPVKGNFRITP
jgi:hypothetical protein